MVWAFQILAAAQFFLTGLDKLSDAPPMVQLFATVGFGQWFRYVTGTVEIVERRPVARCRRMAAIGAVLLAMTMIGALIAHFDRSPVPSSQADRLLLMMACVVVRLRFSG